MPRCPVFFTIRSRRLPLEGPLFLVTILLLFFCLAPPGQAADKPQPVRIAITPCTDILKTFKEYQPLAAYLEQRIQRAVALVIPRDFLEFERFVKEGTVEFAFQAPHTYVRLAHLYNRAMLLKALTPAGATKHRGVIIVRKDSPMQRIEDLKGKYVIFGAENDMAKNLSARRLLAAKEVDPEKDLLGYKNDGSCESIALNVFLTGADAGAVCDYSFIGIDEAQDGSESEIPPKALRILGQTEEVPTWVFAARIGTDDGLVSRLTEALIAISPKDEEHREILESAEVGGFVKAADSDYDEVRKIVLRAR